MSRLLELTLVLVLLALAAGVVTLLWQLRRTAQGLDAFLVATRKDLAQITEDVHASRVRMDHLTASLQTDLDEVAGFIGALREVKEGVQMITGAVRRALDPTSNALIGLLGGLTAAIGLFRRSRTPKAEAPARPEPSP